jgi:TRAP-type C4-dicarboxylate transport system permease small subunit
MDRLVAGVERAAGTFLAAVALLVFAGVVARDLFDFNIPDSFDFSRYLQGIAIFWGLAVASYRNDHINVDIVWEQCDARRRRWIDLFATAVTLAFMAIFAWMLADTLPPTVRANQLTSDTGIPVWPFFLVAALGILAAAAVTLARLVRLARGESVGR